MARAMRGLRWGFVAAIVCTAGTAVDEGRAQTVANGYIRLGVLPTGGVAVAWDPAGRGAYTDAPSWLGPWGAVAPGRIAVDGQVLRVSGAEYVNPDIATAGFPGPFDYGEDLPANGNMGQSFVIAAGEGLLQSVWALVTGEGRPDSVATFTLRRDGPEGAVLVQRRGIPVPENEKVTLLLPEPAPPGTYYLEISEKGGGVYWWSARRDAHPQGTAFLQGKPLADRDRCFGYQLTDRGQLDWTAELVGAQLHCTLAVTRQERTGYRPALAVTFPWQRDGYDTSDVRWTPFRHLVTDSGCFLPVEAFKRLSGDWSLDKGAAETRFAGTGGFDLRLVHAPPQLRTRMDADRIHFLFDNGGRVDVLPPTDDLPPYFPHFFTSDAALNPRLDRFLWTFLSDISSTPCTFEFDSARLCWMDGPLHDQFQRIVLHFTHRIDADGYIWCRGESRGWNGSDCQERDGRLYDSNAPYLLACERMYRWTGDRQFLDAVLPTVRQATDFLLDKLHGRDGILTIDSPEHSGLPASSAASSYFDCIPAGYRDAYINAFFLPAVAAAADLERAGGHDLRARELEELLPLIRERFNATFWDTGAGRYISWIDVQGTRHDCGMTYVNTIAATHGLADAEQAGRMFRWMTDDPTAAGQPDTFSRWIFAPRSNTIHCSEQRNKYPYDEWCEDGGAILWTAYYEIMARVRFRGADDAWRRFLEIVARYDMPDHLVGGNPLYRGELNNHNDCRGSVGVSGEFPESGLTPSVFLYAFVGAHAAPDGLRLRPNIPAALSYVGVDGLHYCGRRLKITAHRDRVEVETQSRTLRLPYNSDGSVLITQSMLTAG
ncbi:MAG: glucosidase family protein [Pirellulaceae bacterium]